MRRCSAYMKCTWTLREIYAYTQWPHFVFWPCASVQIDDDTISICLHVGCHVAQVMLSQFDPQKVIFWGSNRGSSLPNWLQHNHELCTQCTCTCFSIWLILVYHLFAGYMAWLSCAKSAPSNLSAGHTREDAGRHCAACRGVGGALHSRSQTLCQVQDNLSSWKGDWGPRACEASARCSSVHTHSATAMHGRNLGGPQKAEA